MIWNIISPNFVNLQGGIDADVLHSELCNNNNDWDSSPVMVKVSSRKIMAKIRASLSNNRLFCFQENKCSLRIV